MKKTVIPFLCLALLLCLFAVSPVYAEEKIKVACVGDSITEGWASTNADTCSYPAQLQNLLGTEGYEVKNFGVGGRCAMKEIGSLVESYWNNSFFTQSKNYQPDVVILMLGTNDAVDTKFSAEVFHNDLKEMVNVYQSLASHPTVYLATPCTSYDGDHPANIQGVVVPEVKKVAAETGATLVDINAYTANHSDWFGDGIHPTDAGYFNLAMKFFEDVFNGEVLGLNVKTKPGNRVSIGALTSVADSNGIATIKTSNGAKSVRIAESGKGFVDLNIEINGATYADCSELVIVENLGLSAEAIAVPAGAGKYTEQYLPSHLFDDNESTGWQCSADDNPYPVWAGAKFSEKKTFNTVEIVWESGTRAAENGYTIQCSDDGATWTNVSVIQKTVNSAVDTITFADITSQYVRVNITEGSNSKYRPQIFEMRILKSGEKFNPSVTYGAAPDWMNAVADDSTSESTSNPTTEPASAPTSEVTSIDGGDSIDNSTFPVIPVVVCGIIVMIAVAVIIVFAIKKKKLD